jgi:glycosyltransferase involved in cell wall biosynthesis
MPDDEVDHAPPGGTHDGRTTPQPSSPTDAEAPGSDRPSRLVSVIIPCYRQAHFLASALRSAAAQTHRPLELIVVDDGSPDDVAAVTARFPDARLLRQPNRGLAAARNAGLRASSGDYVAFLDADDVLYPHALALGLATLAQRPDCGFAAGLWRVREVDGTVTTPPRVKPPGSNYAAMLARNFIVMHGTVLYRRSALTEIGAFREELPSCEDYDVYLRLLRRTDVALYDEVVAEYRRHDSNMTSDSDRMMRGFKAALGAQWAHASRDPALAAAYARGMTAERSAHSEGRLTRASNAIRSRSDLSEVVRAVWSVIRHDPVLLVQRSVRMLWRMTFRRAATARRAPVNL